MGEVIEETFTSFTRTWVTLIVGNLIAVLISFSPALLWMAVTLPPLIIRAKNGAEPASLLNGVFFGTFLAAVLSASVLSILFAPAQARIALAAARGERPRISAIFD